MSARRDPSGQYPYGTAHRRLREQFARRMRQGEVFECWRPDCQLPDVPITLGARWDLGHVETPELRAVYGLRWPEHRSCNRSTLTHAKAGSPGTTRPVKPAPPRLVGRKLRFGAVGDLRLARRLMDDPAVAVERWSEHWFGGFDLRCADCRELRRPCEVARRFEEATSSS